MADFQVLKDKTITFIGGGNMAGAIIDGLLAVRAAHDLPFTIAVSDRNADKLAVFDKKGVQTCQPDGVQTFIERADVLVLAVKPQVMLDMCRALPAKLDKQVVLSVAAGLPVSALGEALGCENIVRSMPNLPSAVGLGATGLFAKENVSDDDRALAEAVMRAVGITTWVHDEAQMHTITAVAGSAPAYFFYVLENMIAKAVAMGLDEKDAHAFAVQSMIGAGELAKAGDPATLRAQVTSKGGTTAAALAVLAEQGVGEAFGSAMQACADRSCELGKAF
ncbi:pyrroline-5-carboxylate reductase [Moraxella caviae]|uniref:Pyrroline-5-carboxylate reductase n=1 Tax=Moraxella caviae TaxID=34060 RepID=A0A1T0A377_9GAMM|nr:pyrroline-5-carboxylate reductase [Moraxella caviae]OOR89781.1 pyrroline-5-carboxylate reductase [Moraxella caviae]STZ10724.1 Pyrroline-5-carboxylate reductase [Moraxella caviae]VEW11824.1 Pyrroline-5-carboxylate reductase [Moraxella caviae]